MERGKPKVLFVDDEAALLDAIHRSLRSFAASWDMTFLTNPVEALAAAKSGQFDVIVSDLRMPGMDGLEMLKNLRDAGVQSQAIILTGTGDMAQAVQAINTIRIFRFYTKPCPSSALASGIEDAIAYSKPQDNAGQFAQTALDALPLAALAVDQGGKVLFSNRMGGEFLAEKSPLMLDANEICRAMTPGETMALHQAIAGVARGGLPLVLALTGKDDERFSALVEAPAACDMENAAILFVRALDGQGAPSIGALKQLFGLSPTEARLAHELAKGQDVRDAAQAMGVTVNTARTYLRTIFQKTGVNRQSELMRLLISATGG
ncbi:CheY-like receiver [Rhodospirillaceae bacterium LM-1]|nr:CheY-like receiver [Rhodospirillaceae bacterium LM-1]